MDILLLPWLYWAGHHPALTNLLLVLRYSICGWISDSGSFCWLFNGPRLTMLSYSGGNAFVLHYATFSIHRPHIHPQDTLNMLSMIAYQKWLETFFLSSPAIAFKMQITTRQRYARNKFMHETCSHWHLMGNGNVGRSFMYRLPKDAISTRNIRLSCFLQKDSCNKRNYQ